MSFRHPLTLASLTEGDEELKAAEFHRSRAQRPDERIILDSSQKTVNDLLARRNSHHEPGYRSARENRCLSTRIICHSSPALRGTCSVNYAGSKWRHTPLKKSFVSSRKV